MIWLTQIPAHFTNGSYFSFVTAVRLTRSLIVFFYRFIPKPKASFNHFMTDIEPLQGAKDGSTQRSLILCGFPGIPATKSGLVVSVATK